MLPSREPALRVVAAHALIAAFDADEGGLAAFGALRHRAAALLARKVHDLALDECGRGTESSIAPK